MAEPTIDYSKYIYQRPDNNTYFSLIGGTARQLYASPQELAALTGGKPIATHAWGGDDIKASGGAMDLGTFKQNVYAMDSDVRATVDAFNNPQVAAPTPISTAPAFRPRAEGEDMGAYLQAKQASGDTGIKFTSPQATALATQLAQPTAKLPKAVVSAIPGTQPQPKGFIKGYDTNNGGAAVWVEPGKYYPGISLGPVPTGNITPGSMEGAKQFDLTRSADGTIDINASTNTAVAGAGSSTKSYEDYVKQFTTPLTDAEKQAKSLGDMMVGLATGNDRLKDQLQAEKDAGIQDLTNQVNGIVSQIQAKQAEFEAFKQAQQGKPITLASISGSIAQEQGRIASEILLLQAQGDILTGKLNAAQANVNRAIDLKYAALDNQYKIFGAQLEALQPSLNRDEKIRAMALTQMNADRQATLQATKDAQKKQYDVILGYIEKYRDAGITFTDTLAQAQEKLKRSKIYQQETRLAGGGSSGETSTGGTIDSVTQYYVNQVNAGEIPPSLEGVPAAYKTKVAIALSQPKTIDYSGATFNGLTVTFKDGTQATFPNETALNQFKTDNKLGTTLPVSTPTPTTQVVQSPSTPVSSTPIIGTPGAQPKGIQPVINLVKSAWDWTTSFKERNKAPTTGSTDNTRF